MYHLYINEKLRKEQLNLFVFILKLKLILWIISKHGYTKIKNIDKNNI